MLRILIVVLAATLLGLGIVGQVERARRTAEAPIDLIGVDYQASSYLGIPAGHNVRYSYAVGGGRYSGLAFRGWSVKAIKAAKVCYDPADPRNHNLVRHETSCPS